MSIKQRQKVARKVPVGRTKQATDKRKTIPSASRPVSAPVTRDAAGRFIKGVSGNPAGKFVVAAEVRELARQHGSEAIEKLVFWMRSSDPQSSITAAKILLDRGYGKATQVISSPNGAPLVNINMGAPITTTEDAARVYAELCRDPSLDISGLKFAPAKPVLLEQQITLKEKSK